MKKILMVLIAIPLVLGSMGAVRADCTPLEILLGDCEWFEYGYDSSLDCETITTTEVINVTETEEFYNETSGLNDTRIIGWDLMVYNLTRCISDNWVSPIQFTNNIYQVVEYLNGTKSKVNFSDVTWNTIDKAGFRIGEENGVISGFNKDHGQVINYLNDYDEPALHTFVRVHAEKNSNNYSAWITKEITSVPEWSETEIQYYNQTGLEKDFGYRNNISILGFTFPSYIGIRVDEFHEKVKIPINFTTPIPLDNVSMEYIIVVNPDVTDTAKKLKYVVLTTENGLNATTNETIYNYTYYELNELVDNSGVVPNMTHSFYFLTENNKTISWINFEKEFNLSESVEWKIKEVTLPNGNSTYVLSLNFWFGAMSAGETLSLNADWFTPSSVSSYSSELLLAPASNSSDDDTGTYWAEARKIGDVDGAIYEWYITYNLGSTKSMDKIRIYTDGDDRDNPCSVGVVKVCDDAACSGESDLISSDCTFSSSLEWQECSFTETTGQYVFVEGGIDGIAGCINQTGGAAMTEFYEFDIQDTTFDVSDCKTITSSGTYTLTQSLSNKATNACINIDSADVIFDCQGYTIDGNDVADYGIDISGESYDNVTIQNCVLTDWDTGGIAFKDADDILIDNVSISSCPDNALYFYSSSNIDNMYINNSELSNNGRGFSISSDIDADLIINNSFINSNNPSYGAYFLSDAWYGIEIYNTEIKNNTKYDILATGSSIGCGLFLSNVTGTGDKPILFFNTSVNLQNWNNNWSEIILCGANDSTLDNVDYSGSNKNGIYILNANNISFSNCDISNARTGIYTENANNVTIVDSSFNGSANNIRFYISKDIEINNITSTNADGYGLSLYGTTDNVTTYNSNFADNGDAGIQVHLSATNVQSYNNLFNQTTPAEGIYILNANDWNTTEQSGTRIIGSGTDISGNAYINGSGTGYYYSCDDTDTDGFCDDPYDLENNAGGSCSSDNCDYNPLSDEYSAADYLTFNITLVGESDVASNGTTEDIEFNASGTTESNVEPCVVSGSCQNDGSSIAIFEFTNTGSVALNWTVCIDSAMPGTINIECGGTNNPASASAVPLCSSSNLTLQSNVATDATVKGYCWSDFSSALASDSTLRNITHASIDNS